MKPQRIEGTVFLRRLVFRPSDGAKNLLQGFIEALLRGPADKGFGLPELLGPGQDAQATRRSFARIARCRGLFVCRGRRPSNGRRTPRRQSPRLRTGQAHPRDRSARRTVHHRLDRSGGVPGLCPSVVCARMQWRGVDRGDDARRFLASRGRVTRSRRAVRRPGADRCRGVVGGGDRRNDPQAGRSGRTILRSGPAIRPSSRCGSGRTRYRRRRSPCRSSPSPSTPCMPRTSRLPVDER